MQLDWIDDILAVIDTGSLAHAAERRFLTQSAFTRRVRSIEDRLGTALFDRSRKPVTIMPGVLDMEPELRELSSRLRRVQQDLKASVEHGRRGVTIICQHAITTTISPQIVKHLTDLQELPVQVRTGNRDHCLMMLLSGEADFAVTYELPTVLGLNVPAAFEGHLVGSDTLVPVVESSLLPDIDQGQIPAITYPPDVFLGRIFAENIFPHLPRGAVFKPKAETSLTLAACEYALSGIGVAWLPMSLVTKHLQERRLARVEGLPEQVLSIKLMRLIDYQSTRSTEIWHMLKYMNYFKSES